MATPYAAAPQRKSILPTLALLFAGGIALCGGLFVALVVFLSLGPEGGVRLGNEMETYALEYIADHQILEEDEEIVAYYDVTISLSGKEAAILTDRRLVYHKDGRNTSIALDDIEGITHRQETIIGDVIEVKGGGTRMKIEIAPLNDAQSFVSALRDESGITF